MASPDTVVQQTALQPSSTNATPVARAFKSPMAWCLLLCVLAFGLALDLGSKHWAFRSIASAPVALDREVLLANPDWIPPFHQPVAALPLRLLEFQLVINRGAVFGIADNQRGFFITFTLAALTSGLWVFGRFTARDQRLAHVALGLILAGGIGNLYDRIVFGVVRDFLRMLPAYRLPFEWRWPGGSPELFPWVFNVADMLLLIGMSLLLIHMNRMERRRSAAMKVQAQPQITA